MPRHNERRHHERRKRPDIIADRVREQIIEHALVPGDRVPGDWLSPELVGASRGTLREALKILEFQGLVSSRTGPGGGVFVSKVSPDRALQVLDNLFLFQAPSVRDIYRLRKLLEPELAASVAGTLTDEAFDALQATIRLYESEPATLQEEYEQRLAELDFHTELARHANNAPLGFVCTFLVSLLSDMTDCRALYEAPHPELRHTALHYQVQLLRALRSGHSEQARQLMSEHMHEAEAYMMHCMGIEK